MTLCSFMFGDLSADRLKSYRTMLFLKTKHEGKWKHHSQETAEEDE